MKKPPRLWRNISPRILPINFTAGKDSPSYEFYNPSVAARQLRFGQVPPFPFFASKVQFRGALDNSSLSYSRLKDLEPDVDMTLLADWQIAPFATNSFIQGWSEWQEHIFCKSANLYCIALDNNYQSGEHEVQAKSTPTMSFSTSCLQPLTSTLCRMMIGILQQSVRVGSRSTTLCQPISQISATVLQLWQMWPLGENVRYLIPRRQLVRKRNLQANLQQRQHPKQTLRSTFPPLLQKVKAWTSCLHFIWMLITSLLYN